MTGRSIDTELETIELRFRFDLDLFLEATERHEARIPAPRFTTRVLVLSRIVLLVCAVFLLAIGEWRVGTAALAGAGMTLFVRRARRFLASRNFEKSPHADEDVVLTLGRDDFHGLATRGEMRFPWDAFTHAFLEDDGVLLLRGPHLYHWLPDRAIVRGDAASLRALARANVTGRSTSPAV